MRRTGRRWAQGMYRFVVISGQRNGGEDNEIEYKIKMKTIIQNALLIYYEPRDDWMSSCLGS